MTSKEHEKWLKDNNLFISRVYYRLSFNNIGIYILNAYKFNWFPKFFGMSMKYYTECGISWLGWIIELQWSR